MNLKPLALILLLISGTVFAQNFTTISSQANPAGFLSTSADPQSRQGWMGIGATSAFSNGPAAPVDVRGLITAADSLQVLGNMFIANKAAIGGTLPSGDGLKVSNGTIRIAGLSYTPATAGSVKKRLCINPLGKVVTCATGDDTAVKDLCTNITGYQPSLPFTYYEQGTGQKVVVNDPNTDGVCTRIDTVCSDGVDNDSDGYIDAADGNCYDNVIAGGTAPNGWTVVNKQSTPISGNNTTAGVFTAAISNPTIKIGDRYFKFNPSKTFPSGFNESSITTQTCGDGAVQSPEACDDGNSSNTDTCSNSCTLTYCGDAIYQAPNGNGQTEQCDDGNGSNTDQCNGSCNRTFCGDGIRQIPNGNGQSEACDNGSSNGASGGTCSSSCTISKIFVRITSNYKSYGTNSTTSTQTSYISPSGYWSVNTGGQATISKISFFSDAAGTVPINISNISGGLIIHHRFWCSYDVNGGGGSGFCTPSYGYQSWQSGTDSISSGTSAELEEKVEYYVTYPDPNAPWSTIYDAYTIDTELLNGTSLSTLKYEII